MNFFNRGSEDKLDVAIDVFVGTLFVGLCFYVSVVGGVCGGAVILQSMENKSSP